MSPSPSAKEGPSPDLVAVRALYEDELRRRVPAPPGMRREEDPFVTRLVGPTPHPLDHMVFHSRLSAENADDVVDAEVDRARRERHGMQWNVYGDDEPRDLVQRLERRGLRIQATETVLVISPTDAISRVPSAPGVDVRRITTEEGLIDFHAVDEAVWGTAFTAWVRAWILPALAGKSDPVGVFVAYDAGVPAGCAWVSLPRERSFAHLFGGTVHPAHRGKGLYRALVSARATLARASGFSWLVTDANSNSAPILRRRGFLPIATRIECVLDAPAAASPPP